MIRRKNNFVMALLYVVSIIYIESLVSCNYFSEPEPYTDPNVKAPTSIYYADIRSQVGSVVNGEVIFNFRAPEDSNQIMEVRLYIDSILVSSSKLPPYQYSINTKLWLNGKHKVSFYVYKKNHNVGLQNLIGAPSIVYYDSVQFANAPLVPEKFIPGLDPNNHPKLSWTQKNKPDVEYYIIERLQPLPYRSDTIKVSDVNEYADTSIFVCTGMGINYRVGAGNSKGVSLSGPVLYQYGTKTNLVILKFDVIEEFDDDVLLTVASEYIFNASCQTISSNGGTSLEWGQIMYAAAVSPFNNNVYVWSNKSGQIYKFNSKLSWGGRKIITTDPINTPISSSGVTVGLNDRLFLVNKSGELRVIDTSGVLLNNVPNFLSQGSKFIKISPDGLRMVAVDGNLLKKFSVSGNNVTLDGQIDIGGIPNDWRILWDESKVIISASNGIIIENTIWNLNDYTSRNITYPRDGISLNRISLGNNSVFIPYVIDKNGDKYTVLVEYDINTVSIKKEWLIYGQIESFSTSRKGRYFYVNIGYRSTFIIDKEGDSI